MQNDEVLKKDLNLGNFKWCQKERDELVESLSSIHGLSNFGTRLFNQLVQEAQAEIDNQTENSTVIQQEVSENLEDIQGHHSSPAIIN